MAYDITIPRLPDPTTVPAGPGFTTQSLVPNSPGLLHKLNTGGTISVKHKGDYWTLSISIPDTTIDESQHLIPFIYSLQGGFSNFYVQLPTHVNPKTGAWTVDVNGYSGAGNISLGPTSNSITITDYNNGGVGGTYSVGDLLKFSNSHKIYMITKIFHNLDDADIYLSSEILEPVKIPSSALQPNGILFRVRLENTPKLSLNADGLYGSFNLQLRENIL